MICHEWIVIIVICIKLTANVSVFIKITQFSMKSLIWLAFLCTGASSLIIYHLTQSYKKRKIKDASKIQESAYSQLVGNTPLIKLHTLSRLLNREIYVKIESMNPGGTGKDRAVKSMLAAARQHPNYSPGCLIVEGSSGSTGISLASQCQALGLRLCVVMPDDQANEKKALLENLGATVIQVPCCAISNEMHYVNQARRIALENDGIFIDQFENTQNYDAHYTGTGPEIWAQTSGRLDAFVMSAGTGGTLAGVSR